MTFPHTNKKIILFSLLISLNTLTYAESDWDNFWNAIFGILSSDTTSPRQRAFIDYTAIRSMIKQKLYAKLELQTQPYNIRQELEHKINKASDNIIQLLQAPKYASQYQIEQQASSLTENAILEILADISNDTVETEILRIKEQPPINPQFMRPQAPEQFIAQEIKQEMRRNAQEVFARGGSLKQFTGQQLENTIRYKVEKAYGVHEQQSPQHTDFAQDRGYNRPTPSAPPMQPTQPAHSFPAHLILPKNATPEEKMAILSTGYHEADECYICSEEYVELGKKVVLRCGHPICTDCLKNWIYNTGKSTCPVCRAHIKRSDFPQSYIS